MGLLSNIPTVIQNTLLVAALLIFLWQLSRWFRPWDIRHVDTQRCTDSTDVIITVDLRQGGHTRRERFTGKGEGWIPSWDSKLVETPRWVRPFLQARYEIFMSGKDIKDE